MGKPNKQVSKFKFNSSEIAEYSPQKNPEVRKTLSSPYEEQKEHLQHMLVVSTDISMRVSPKNKKFG